MPLTIEDFMSAMHASFMDALKFSAEFAMTVSTIHPRSHDEQNAQGVYEFVFDGGVPVRFERVVLPVDMINMVQYFYTFSEKTSPIDKLSIMNMESMIENAFDNITDPEDMDKMMPIISPAAQYMGMFSQLRVEMDNNKRLQIQFLTGAQVHADTEAMERDQAKELGIEHTYKPSNPDRLIELSNFTIKGLEPI